MKNMNVHTVALTILKQFNQAELDNKNICKMVLCKVYEFLIRFVTDNEENAAAILPY
jgi:hypothetical protein